MTIPPPETEQKPSRARWGTLDVIVVFLLAYSAAIVAQALYIQVKDIPVDDFDPDIIPLGDYALLQAPLWFGFLVVPIVITMWRGNGPVYDLGLRMGPKDAPLGVVIGVACQFILVPLVSLPVLWLTNEDLDELEESARALTDRATGAGGVILLTLMVVAVAPVAEEVFYRGMLQRVLTRRLPAWPSMIITAVVFGASHLQPLQFPALVAFGLVLAYIAHRTGRLGLNVWAHVGFNATTVVLLV